MPEFRSPCADSKSSRDWRGCSQEGPATEERDRGDTLRPADDGVALLPAGWRVCILSSSEGLDEVGASVVWGNPVPGFDAVA